ncbi:MAG TPA: hypothetical protein VEA41_04555, partial [Salinarimonas sp.]|nr:hypothetical protein [Salinarimonas sp.]
ETLPVGTVKAGTDWSVTPVQVIVANLLPLMPGDKTPVAFRFTPQGTSGFQIDDVFVDPYRTG